MDDEPDWLSEDIVEEAPAPVESAPAAEGGDGAEPAAAAAEETPEEPEPESKSKRNPDRLILFKHWSRPTTMQYNYLYDYRKNYYDDCIDYMDRRQKGITREIPRAQTWAERALRTYVSKPSSHAYERSRTADITMLSNIKTSGHFYRYHTKEYMSRRFVF